jgi:adenosylmethionine-8-amino-7-oxononanoate aminotransferase
MDTKSLDKKYFGRDSSKDLEIVSAEDSYLYDASGKQYIDLLGGWCVGNLGWSNKEISRAIAEFKGPPYIHPSLYYRPWAELAELIASMAPGKLQKVYRTTGGSESVEAALLMAICYTGRNKFLSLEDSYHGNTMGALSIGASENREQYSNLPKGFYKIKKPLDDKALDRIETRLKNKDIAAFVMEPVICNLGVTIPGHDFMKNLQKLCRKYGTLLVMDEVATGFGRTGKMFATEHYDIEPDIMTMGKAITGGYAGMGATITTEKIAKKIEGKFSLYSTYGWHPLSVAASIATLRYYIANKESLLNNVAAVSNLFCARLMNMKFKQEPEINIKGLAISVDAGKASYAKKIQQKCLEAGVLFNAEDTKLSMFPALNIERAVAEKALDIMEECI